MQESREYLHICAEMMCEIEKVKNAMFTEEERELKEHVFHSKEEYIALMKKYSDKYEKFEILLNDAAKGLKYMYYKAHCSVCGKQTVMFYWGNKDGIREKRMWTSCMRENFACSECENNARMRYVISKLKMEYEHGMKVYMYEHETSGFRSVSKFVREEDLTGSEFFGNKYKSGDIINGVLNEDATNLSFANNSFDRIVSLDVLEHIYPYERALEESYRVLKPGGKLLLTTPVSIFSDQSEERAKIINGKTVHLKEPIYHGGGNYSDFGVLEYTTFGWDLVDTMKKKGFSKVNMIASYSINEAYLGSLGFYFELIK